MKIKIISLFSIIQVIAICINNKVILNKFSKKESVEHKERSERTKHMHRNKFLQQNSQFI